MATLDQQRAAYAWTCIQSISKDYVNLAKAAPALIMNNGLMQTLAYYNDKDKEHHRALSKQLQSWLKKRFPEKLESDNYANVMQAFFTNDSRFYQQATDETLALLRWIRQFASANAINSD